MLPCGTCGVAAMPHIASHVVSRGWQRCMRAARPHKAVGWHRICRSPRRDEASSAKMVWKKCWIEISCNATFCRRIPDCIWKFFFGIVESPSSFRKTFQELLPSLLSSFVHLPRFCFLQIIVIVPLRIAYVARQRIPWDCTNTLNLCMNRQNCHNLRHIAHSSCL